MADQFDTELLTSSIPTPVLESVPGNELPFFQSACLCNPNGTVRALTTTELQAGQVKNIH